MSDEQLIIDKQQQATLDALFNQAIALHQAGQVGAAEPLYRRILQTFPKHVDVNYNLGLIAMQTGHQEPALQHFKIAYDAVPANSQFVLTYVNALYAAGYLVDAKKIVKTARQSGQDSPELKKAQRAIEDALVESLENPNPTHAEWQSLSALFNEQKWQELEARANKLSAKYARSGRVWNMLSVAQQAQGKDFLDAKRKAAQYSPREIDLHISLSVDLRQRGFNDEAETLLRNMVKNYPDQVQPLHNLGVFLGEQGRVLEATSMLRKALGMNPDFIRSNCALAILMHNAGQADQTRELIGQALAIKTVNPDDILARAQMLTYVGQTEEAAMQFNQVLEISPQNLDALNGLGTALKALGMRNDAAKCFYRAIELYPNHPVAHNNLGTMLHEDREFNNAVTCFRRALSLAPNFVDALTNLASTCLMLERSVDAIECLRYAVTLTPANPLIHCNLGLALQSLGQFDEAMQCYQNALRISPEFAFVYSNMGSIYATTGQMEQAEDAMTKALQQDPQDPRVMAIALLHIPYRADDARFAELETMYANRASYRFDEHRFLCLGYARAMEQSGEADKAKAARDEAESMMVKAA